MMKITVGICSKGRESKLIRCLDGLKKQSKFIDRIILIEDISVEQHFDRHRLQSFFKNQENIEFTYNSVRFLNIAKSRQEVLKSVSSGILIFIDNDIVVPNGVIKKVNDFFEKNKKTALLVGKVEPLNKKNNVSIVDYVYCTQDTISIKKKSEIKVCPIPFGALNISLIKKKGEGKNVFFDPNLQLGEDVDFTLKLTKNSFKILFDPNIIVYHEYETSLLNYLKRKFINGKYVFLLHQSHGDVFDVRALLPKIKRAIYLPFFITYQAYFLTSYYSSLYPLNFFQKVFTYLGEVALLLGFNYEIKRAEKLSFSN